MDYVKAFFVGGAVCALVQILMEKTKMMPGRIFALCMIRHLIQALDQAQIQEYNIHNIS